MGKRGPYITGVSQSTRVALQQKKAKKDAKKNLNIKISAEMSKKFSLLKTDLNITNETLFTIMLDRWTLTESAVAPQLQIAEPLVERTIESSKVFSSIPIQLGRVQGLQTQEVSDIAEGLRTPMKLEPGAAPGARGQPKLHSPGMKKTLKKPRYAYQRKICIGNQITRWNKFKNLTEVKSHEDAARILLDRYFGTGLSEEADEERQSSFVNPFVQTVGISQEEECDEVDSSDTEYKPSFNLAIGEPENLQMDCETVQEDNLHENTEMNRTGCFSTPVAPREPENLQMDFETVHEDNLHEDTEMHRTRCLPTAVAPRSNGQMSSDHVLYIHGLPVNQPFSFQYSSPATGRIVESKKYIILKQQFVPNIKATPIKIDVKGLVHKISSGPNVLKVSKKQKKETCNLVDTCHLRQSLESLKPYSDSSQGMLVIGKESEGFENVTIKMESDEDKKNAIVSDILNDLINKVVRESNIQRNHGISDSKRKNKHQTMCNITKKQRILKYEDNVDGELPHSSRSRSRGYRINETDIDKLGGLGHVGDLTDILSDLDESDDDSSVTKSKVRKKMEEDPDFDLETVFMTKSDKRNFKDNELNTESSSFDNYRGSASDLANDKCGTAEKQMLEKEKMMATVLQRLEEQRMRVFLKDHPDKYYTETQVSVERKFRGLKEADKTFKLLVCALCKQFRTSNTVLLETHLEHHLNGDWKCKKCNFEGNTLQEYTLHMNENHPSGKRCFVCKKKYGWKKLLHEHLAKAHNLLPYVCTRCSTDKSYVMFKEKSEYHHHYLENHKDVMHQCTFCGLYFLNSSACRLHTCSGRESEMATCDICGKEMRRESLRRHKRDVHDNVRPFPCQLCSYAAKTARNLGFHISAKHEGVHQFKCEICDFTCVRKYQLVSHMRTHTGDKPYKCDLCPYSAAWNVQLKEHRQLHGNPLGKECDICGIVVRKGVSYNNHYKKHNRIECDKETTSL